MVFNFKIINSTKFKLFFLFLIAFLPRIINLGGHSVFVDEITWMSRAKDVYAAVRTHSWSPYNAIWWLNPGVAESIGLPITFLSGLSITFLSSGYSHYSLNIARDFVAARFPDALIGSLFMPLFYFLLKKFVGDKLAFISSLLLALDPVFLGSSRWLHQDVPLMTFSTLSILLYLYSKKKIAIIGSAFLAAMAILTKPQGFLIIIVLYAVSLISILIKQKAYIKSLIGWTVFAAFFTVLFFPFLWSNPIGNMLQYLSVQIGNVGGGNLTIFNGQITTNPPWYYYFAIFPFRLPESVLFGFLVGLVTFSFRFKRNFLKNQFLQASFIYIILFVTIISFSDKKLGIRYLLGVWPYVYIISVYGLIYVEKFIHKKFFKIIFWLLIFFFPIWGILRFYPSYYLFYNHFITPAKYQSLEAVGYCDSVKPAIEYLGPKLYHGVKIMLPGCDSAINYYTGFTIYKVESVSSHPDYVILETLIVQKVPEIQDSVIKAGYKEIKEIDFRGLVLAKIYQKPYNK